MILPRHNGTERLAYTIADACRALGVGKTKLYALIGAGRLDARSLGKKTLITAESVQRLLDSLPRAPIGGGQKVGMKPAVPAQQSEPTA